MSVALDISGTIHHMIVVCGTRVSRQGFSNHFFKILIFWVVRIVKVRKYQSVKMTKKLFPLHFISQEPYMILWGTCVKG